MPKKIFLALLLLLMFACEDDSTPSKSAVADPDACPSRLDSVSVGSGKSLQNCKNVFARNLARLQKIKVTTSGFVSGSTWYSFDSMGCQLDVPSSAIHPVMQEYLMLIQNLCVGDTIPSARQSCVVLEHGEFIPETGLPVRIDLQVKARPGVDVDAITGWKNDSAVWRTK